MISVSKETFDRYKVLSLFFSILVVSMHVNNLERYQVASYSGIISNMVVGIETFISSFLANAAVPYFFFSSGFMFFRGMISPMAAKKKACRRLMSLGIPYMLWNAIFFFYFLFLTRMPVICDLMNMDRVPFSIRELMESVLLYKYNYVFWFVFQLLFYYCLSPIIALVLKKRWIAILTALFVFFLANITNTVLFLRIDGLLYFYYGACFVNYAGMKSKIFDVLKQKRIAFLLVSVSFLLYSYAMPYFGRIISLLYPFAIMWAAYLLLPPKPCLCGELANATFFLYAFHTLITEIIKKPLYLLLPHTPVFALLTYMWSLMLTVYVSSLVVKYMKRFVPNIYAYLVGNRGG